MKHIELPVIEMIKQKIANIDPQADVFLYGSRARGDFNEESDWDILILTQREVKKLKEQAVYRAALLEVMDTTQQVISCVIRNKDDWHAHHVQTPFYKALEKESVPI